MIPAAPIEVRPHACIDRREQAVDDSLADVVLRDRERQAPERPIPEQVDQRCVVTAAKELEALEPRAVHEHVGEERGWCRCWTWHGVHYART